MIKKLNEIELNNKTMVMLDTNILLKINGPESFSNDKISNSFEKMIQKDVHFFVNQAILSEFINISIKYYFKEYKKRHKIKKYFPYKGHYKHKKYINGYRDTKDFKDKYNIIIEESINDGILKFSNIVGSEQEDIKKAIERYRNLDFNDEQIIQDSKSNSLMIWTMDKDYYPNNLIEDNLIIFGRK